MKLCKHYPQCGGCTFQGLTEAEERERKVSQFRDACGDKYPVLSFFQAPLNSRRRASLTSKRTKKSTQAGFLEARTHNIVDMEECQIITSEIFALKSFMATVTSKAASRSAQLKFHITQCENGFDIVIENAKELTPELRQDIAHLCPTYNIRRLVYGAEPIYRDDAPLVKMAGHLVEIPPHPFLQASRECEDQLRKWVHEALSDCKTVCDIFAGLGTFSFGLGSEIEAFEGSQSLVDLMQANLDRLQQHNIKANQRDLFRDPLVASELAQFDGVIIDPPRAGAKAQCEALAKSNVDKIAYVSCDPETFERDARTLVNGGYVTEGVHLADQFRFSNHLEIFALFRKSS